MSKIDAGNTNIATNSSIKKSKGIVLSLLLVVMVSAFPSYYIFTQNALEITLAETLIPVGLSIFIGVSVFFLTLLIFKKAYISALLSSILVFCFLNFGLFRQAAASVPFFSKHEIWGGLLFAAIILTITIFLFLKANKKEEIIKKIFLVFTIVFSCLIIFNTVLAFPSILKTINSGKDSDKSYETVALNHEGDLHNIYYFILDEYGSFASLEKYYGYPNSGFYNFLKEKGFSVSDTSANRSTNTKFVLAENLNLDYVCNEDMINADYLRLIDNAQWFHIMDGLGYTQYSFSTQLSMFPIPDLDNNAEVSEGFFRKFQKVFTGNTEGGENIFTIAYKNSLVFSVFGSAFLEAPTMDGIPVDRVSRVLWVFDDYENFGADDVGEGQMIISYICSPHVPFAFDENGKSQPEEEKYNWSDPKYYLGQLKYVTKRIQTAISNIIEYDPSAIIIIQSDHGFRNHRSQTDGKLNMPFKMGTSYTLKILNAVYFGGEEIDIEGLSGPNTLRAVLIKMGLDFPLIDDINLKNS